MSIGYYTRRKYNFFSYFPQEKSSGAFLMWLIHYLNSEDGFASYRQMFFDNIVLRKGDKSRQVKDIAPVYELEDNVILLSFKFSDEDNNRQAVIVIADEMWDIVTSKALEKVRRLYPDGFNYIYFRMAYISTMEERLLTNEQWSLMNCGLFSELLDCLLELNHPLIKMFYDELTFRYDDEYNEMQERIYAGQDQEILAKPEAARYIYDTFIENMTR